MSNIVRVKLENPEILAWARKEIGLSESDIAKRFNKARDTIISWENGESSPTFRQLSDLANYYKRPIAAFFLPSIPPASPKPNDYRTLPGTELGHFSKETLISYRELYNMIIDTKELFHTQEINTTYSLPKCSLKDNPEDNAKLLREYLNFPVEKQLEEFSSYNIALDVWRSILFDKGVIVRISIMPIIDARAFCLFAEDLAGIGLSNEDRDNGKIFSLFHEVCHLTLNTPGISGIITRNNSPNQDLEQYCDHFSAAFLLPSPNPTVDEFLNLLKIELSFENAKLIANKFKVSKYVVIRRAYDLGYVSNDNYWQIYNEFQSIDHINRERYGKSSGGNYYKTQISYHGKRFVELVMNALYKRQINSFDTRRLVGLTPQIIEANL